MEALKFSEEFTVCDDGAMQTRMMVFAGNVQRQLLECIGTKAECTVNITFRRRWLSGVRFIAIDEEHVPGRSRMPCTSINVLLNAFLDKTDYKMLMCMTCESVLDVMCMNDFGVICPADTINTNPLRGCCHEEQSSNKVFYKTATLVPF